MAKSSQDTFILFSQLLLGVFALTLLVYPHAFWEDTALVPVVITFWKGSGVEQTFWVCRELGCMLLVVVFVIAASLELDPSLLIRSEERSQYHLS